MSGDDEGSALRALGAASPAPEGAALLRRALTEVRPAGDVRCLADHQVRRAVARCLVAGELMLISRRRDFEARALATMSPPTPREVEQASKKTPPPPVEPEKTWIEIELVGEDDRPIPGERYRIELPDGSVREGALDAAGRARVGGIDPGTCKVTFPDLDEHVWEPA